MLFTYLPITLHPHLRPLSGSNFICLKERVRTFIIYGMKVMFRRYFSLTGEIQPQQGVALTSLIINP